MSDFLDALVPFVVLLAISGTLGFLLRGPLDTVLGEPLDGGDDE